MDGSKQYIASISYGKDSLAMLHVIKDILHYPLDRIVTAELWATDTIPADLPPMVEFKAKADEIIRERWGIEVEHFCATWPDGTKRTYENEFHHEVEPNQLEYRKSKWITRGNIKIYGFANRLSPWCNGDLKVRALKTAQKATMGSVSYVGIAADEGKRIERHKVKENMLLPLVEAGWTEQMCRDWCEENDLLSPTYKSASRGGCWFCFNKTIDEFRQLRKHYPDLWGMLLKWDIESPFTFRQDGRTVHDLNKRFRLEDEGFYKCGERFNWSDLENCQMNIFQFMKENKDG